MQPYYEHAGITIYHGDCREILSELPPIDAVISDPPYGIHFDTNYTKFTSGLDVKRRIHKPVYGDDEPFDPSPLAPVSLRGVMGREYLLVSFAAR